MVEQPPSSLDVAIEEAVSFLLKFSIPLYRNDRKGRPEMIGTGFFVRDGNRNFLISAAHVLDQAKNTGLYFYIKPDITRHCSGQLLRTKGENNRGKDLIDIGVLYLTDGFEPPYPEVDKFPMDLSYLRPNYRPRTKKNYITIGFPVSKNKIKNQPREAIAKPYAYENEPIEEQAYSAHGLDPNIHIALKFDEREGYASDGSKQNFPHPRGMSGSPIIVLYDETGDDDFRVFPVVGVFTSYRKLQRIAFGTDIQYVIDAIRHAI